MLQKKSAFKVDTMTETPCGVEKKTWACILVSSVKFDNPEELGLWTFDDGIKKPKQLP